MHRSGFLGKKVGNGKEYLMNYKLELRAKRKWTVSFWIYTLHKKQEKKLKEEGKTLYDVLAEPEIKRESTAVSTPPHLAAKSGAEPRRRIKGHEKRDQLDKAARRRSIEKLAGGIRAQPTKGDGLKTAPERKPPDITARGAATPVRTYSAAAVSSPRLPVLPTTPIPVSDLPPAAVRLPPAKGVIT
jgi:hypothetical protein